MILPEITHYRHMLEEIHRHLLAFGENRWTARLKEWILNVDKLCDDSLVNEKIREHILRTQKALGGMGSIGDIVICPEAGFKISANKAEIVQANNRLLELIHCLDREINRLLARKFNGPTP